MEASRPNVLIALKNSLILPTYETLSKEIYSRIRLIGSSATYEQFTKVFKGLKPVDTPEELVRNTLETLSGEKINEEKTKDWPQIVKAPFYLLEEYSHDKPLDKMLQEMNVEISLCYETKNPLKHHFIKEMVKEYLPSFENRLFFGSLDSVPFEILVAAALPKVIQSDLSRVIFFSNMFISAEKKLASMNGVSQENIPFSIVSLIQLPSKLETLLSSKNKSPAKESSENEQKMRIGYSFAPKKMRWNFDRGILKDEPAAEFFPVDFRVPTVPKVDVIIHKYTIDDSAQGDLVTRMEKAFEEYFFKVHDKKNGPYIIDPVDHFDTFMSRPKLTEFFSKIESNEELNKEIQKICQKSGFPQVRISTPKSLQVKSAEVGPENIRETIERNNLRYPLFFKTNDAASTKESHMMGLAMDPSGAVELEKNKIFRKHDHIIQEAIDHDMVVFKIYVVGDFLQVNKRESVPNLDTIKFEKSFHFFHSQVKFKSILQNNSPFEPEKVNLNEDILRVLMKHFRKEIGLSLYGLDVLRESKTGTYQLIDINYYPGFKEINLKFKDLLFRLVRKVISERKEQIKA